MALTVLISVIAVSAGRLGILGRGIYYADQSWFYGPMLGLEGAEIGGTLMCISVPALKAFADRFRAKRKNGGETEEPIHKANTKYASDLSFTGTGTQDTKTSVVTEKHHEEMEA